MSVEKKNKKKVYFFLHVKKNSITFAASKKLGHGTIAQ